MYTVTFSMVPQEIQLADTKQTLVRIEDYTIRREALKKQYENQQGS